MTTKNRLLILGTGGMARSHANAFSAIDSIELAACVDTSEERVSEFAGNYGIKQTFTSLDAALAWEQFDAATNVTPDAVHHRTTLALLAAGKHVLCEKPLATNHADAAEMAAAAKHAGVVNMLNLTYRNVAALATAAEMVAAGKIGAIRHFEASYLQSWLTQPAWGDWRTEEQWLWRLSTKHGSNGVLGDVGIHILDFATHIAGSPVAALSGHLKTFQKAENDRIGEYPLDANDSCVMHLTLENGAIGVLHASRFASGHINDLRLRLHGTMGGLDVRFENAESQLYACLDNDLPEGHWQPVNCKAVPDNYQRFAMALQDQTPVQPDFSHGAILQKVLDSVVDSDSGECNVSID